METWTGARRAFAVKVFYKNGDSFVIAQHEFQREFGIHRNRAVPSAHAIKTWVRNFEATGSALKKKGGCVKTVCTPKNTAVVRDAIERIHTVLRVATLRHSGCLKPVFDGFYTTTFLL
jgi:transposase